MRYATRIMHEAGERVADDVILHTQSSTRRGGGGGLCWSEAAGQAFAVK